MTDHAFWLNLKFKKYIKMQIEKNILKILIKTSYGRCPE